MWIGSNRGGHGYDVYVATRPTFTGTWSTPQLVTAVNSAYDDFPSGVSEDGLAMMVTTTRASMGQRPYDLYEATRTSASTDWTTIRAVDELNTRDYEESIGSLSADGLRVYFVSNVGGTTDLYTATRSTRRDPFAEATKIMELSGVKNESHPFISADERHILFTSDRLGTPTDIFESTR